MSLDLLLILQDFPEASNFPHALHQVRSAGK